jgi:L-iditol 2-dehydrogenase
VLGHAIPGVAESFRQVVDSVTPGGIYLGPLPSADVLPLVLKDITVYGSFSGRVDWDEVVNLVEQGRFNLKRLITHKFPLSEAPRAYEDMRSKSDGLVKAVLEI